VDGDQLVDLGVLGELLQVVPDVRGVLTVVSA